ncbi:MAG TPA: hypothetical protein DCQ93_03490 [Bacteroidetes bacterium]|nr:hypothetical protein [Bacteroidota bacterium]
MKKYFFVFSCFILLEYCFSVRASAQDMPDGMIDSIAPKKEFVSATFKGTRLVNFHTAETCGKRTLEFRIAHRFGDLSSGGYNFYGLDGPASLQLELGYSYNGRLEFGASRTSADKMYSAYLKYKLMRQTTDNKSPLTITLLGQANLTGLKSTSTSAPEYHFFSDRFNYVSQIMIARKLSDAFSIQVAPTWVHYNLVTAVTDDNDIFSVIGMGRIKVSKRTALTGEYCYRINTYSQDFSTYHNSVAIGMDLETGGHVFQFFFTNSFGINEAQTIPYTRGDITNLDLKLGFNISRVFFL